LLAPPFCLVQDETCYRPSRLIPFILLRNLIINGLFLSDRIYWIYWIFFSFSQFLPRPPRLSESDPHAIARHERAGGGQAGKTEEQQKSCQSLAQTWHVKMR
jgi:hypothetical protein